MSFFALCAANGGCLTIWHLLSQLTTSVMASAGSVLIMRAYNQPPTEEFAMLGNSFVRDDLFSWFTLMKSVMNDYWFDVPGQPSLVHASLWGEPAYVDLFMHKLYYCWMKIGQHLHSQDAEEN